jgi:hypothetical protein
MPRAIRDRYIFESAPKLMSNGSTPPSHTESQCLSTFIETQDTVSKAVVRMEKIQKPKEPFDFYCSKCKKRGNHRTEKCTNRTPKGPTLNVVRKGAHVVAAFGGGDGDGGDGVGTRPCPLCQNKHYYFSKFLNKRIQESCPQRIG